MNQTSILIKPIITEKSMDEASRGWFTFLVEKSSTKGQIKQAAQTQFKVDVIGIRTLIIKGKRGKAGKKRIKFTNAPYKKAIIKLKEGQRIDLFETQKEEDGKKT